MYVSIVVSYSVAYDATDAMDNDNLATALLIKIQISIKLTGTVQKLLVEPIAWLKDRALPMRNLRRSFKLQCREGLRLCSEMIFASKVSRRSNRFAQLYAIDLK